MLAEETEGFEVLVLSAVQLAKIKVFVVFFQSITLLKHAVHYVAFLHCLYYI